MSTAIEAVIVTPRPDSFDLEVGDHGFFFSSDIFEFYEVIIDKRFHKILWIFLWRNCKLLGGIRQGVL